MNLIPWRNKHEDRTGGRAGERPLASLRGEIDNLFDRFFHDSWGSSVFEGLPARFGAAPRVDVSESEDEVRVRAELPGVDPKEVEIKVVGSMLTISGEKQEDREEKRRNYHYVERQFGSFSRTVQLPTSVDPDKVDASFKNGVLTVLVGKRPDAKPKRITVREG